jgi:benzoyl-CoA 2,3-dioxygenase component B
MLKEEAHHMFVGASGVGRVVQRTVDLMREHDTDDVSPYGGINLDVLQKYVNFHYSVSLDLFGAETSTNAANYFAAGIKGRFQEERRDDDHLLKSDYRNVPEATDDGIGEREVTQLAALNETLREDYAVDCQKGLDRWNRAIADAGVDRSFELPHVGFHRDVGTFRGRYVSPDGRMISDADWHMKVTDWLPNDTDKAHVKSLQVGITEPGKMAGWVAPPSTGIHQKPIDFDYVKL